MPFSPIVTPCALRVHSRVTDPQTPTSRPIVEGYLSPRGCPKGGIRSAMKVLAGSPRLPCGPAATPRAGPLRGRFLRSPNRTQRTLQRAHDTEAPTADSQSGSSLQGALQSVTDLLSSAGSSVKHVLASPTETTQPPSRESVNEARSSSSNGASSGHTGASNPLDEAAKRVKLAAKAITGQPVHSVAASVDEITSSAREAGEGLQGEADKMEGQLKSALSSSDPVNEAATSDEQQVTASSLPAAFHLVQYYALSQRVLVTCRRVFELLAAVHTRLGVHAGLCLSCLSPCLLWQAIASPA